LGVDQSGGSSDTSSTDNSSQRWVYGIGIGASWEADVWGRVRSKKAAAQAESSALEGDYEFARQSLAAAVARAYFSVIEAAQQEANAQETLGLYEEDLKLTDVRKQQGFASDYELVQVKSRTASARDTLIAAQQARAQAIRAIEVVTSHYPAGKLGVRRSFPKQPGAVPAGLPSQILERRPDVVAAERRFAGAFHRTNEARAARLPRFSLSASSGLGTAQLDTVGVLEQFNWTLAAGVIQPIFFGGELKAQQDIRTAEQKGAVADYARVAQRAFSDVESALSAEVALREREAILADNITHYQRALELAQIQFKVGKTDLRVIGQRQLGLYGARTSRLHVQSEQLAQRVNLYLALGGSFEPANQAAVR
jgi:NodT family efflux transporter outer membrane factor (OMF) lipoprotein